MVPGDGSGRVREALLRSPQEVMDAAVGLVEGEVLTTHSGVVKIAPMIQSLSSGGRPRAVLADLAAAAGVGDLIVGGALAGVVGAFAQVAIPVPGTPVPITGQTFAVLLGGMVVGTRRAVIGMLLYLALGLAGVPWFAGHSGGWDVVTSASFGYLIGFVAAAVLVGALARRGFDRQPLLVFVAMLCGNVIIYLLGATWLAIALRLQPAEAVQLGVLPFLVGDALKALVAMACLPGAWYLAVRLGVHEVPRQTLGDAGRAARDA
jgi:biotin transport system substrate-specific component